MKEMWKAQQWLSRRNPKATSIDQLILGYNPEDNGDEIDEAVWALWRKL